MSCPIRSELHPVLAERFSSDEFAADKDLSDSTVIALIDAARWAPSAGNSQPWGFYVARRGTGDHRRIAPHLAPSSRRWALDADLLVVTAVRRHLDDPDMPYSEFADYDLGQAVAHMTIQAQVMGLSCHQFRAFDLDGISAELRPRPGWEVVSMIAIGHPRDTARAQRSRLSVEEIVTRPWGSAR